ncbi:MAG TPA: hypothetical protein VJN93_13575 [Candidatus Acidoferrum sp.]|nr:hypothetical protein [Candidatus Acidoferrum sp.]
MPQQSGPRKVKKYRQMITALDLRAAGATYRQIGEALGVSKPRAFKIVRLALDELIQHNQETVERVRQLELVRLDRYRLALDPRKSDPRVADTLIRISERVAKLHGIDAPQRIEASGPGGVPIQTQEESLDLSKLTVEELLLFEALHNKAQGVADWDRSIRQQTQTCQTYVGRTETLLMAVSKMLLSGAGDGQAPVITA